MDAMEKTRPSSALEINLERTKAVVEIPPRYRILLDVVENHYGVLKRTEEMLVELHHPFVNWDYVLTHLKGLSIGDFYDFNAHENGLSALRTLRTLSGGHLLRFRRGLGTRDPLLLRSISIRSLQERPPAGEKRSPLPRRLSILGDLAETRGILLKILQLHEDLGKADQAAPSRRGSAGGPPAPSRAFRATYLFWAAQPDPPRWFSRRR